MGFILRRSGKLTQQCLLETTLTRNRIWNSEEAGGTAASSTPQACRSEIRKREAISSHAGGVVEPARCLNGRLASCPGGENEARVDTGDSGSSLVPPSLPGLPQSLGRSRPVIVS